MDGIESACDGAADPELVEGGLYLVTGSGLESEAFLSGLFDDICIYGKALCAYEITVMAQQAGFCDSGSIRGDMS